MPASSATRQASFSGKSPPRKPRSVDVRPRAYLTEDEVDRLIRAARRVGRHGHRDATLILMMYRHGLRVSEVVALRWDAIDWPHGRLHVERLKQGTPSVHPLRGPQLRALRRLRRASSEGSYLFISERGGPLSASSVRKLVARAGRLARLSFPIRLPAND